MEKEFALDNKSLDRLLLGISERDFERVLDALPEDMGDVRELLVMRKALLKLATDPEYYEAVKNAVRDLVVEEFFGEKED